MFLFAFLNGDRMPQVLALFVPIIGMVALFSYLSIASWADSRRREREAFYRSELLKKATETQGESSQKVLEILKEEERLRVVRRRESLFLGGSITLAAGIGIGVFLGRVAGDGVWALGLIPALIGLALVVHAKLTLPRLAQ
jgi:hypothetical protein